MTTEAYEDEIDLGELESELPKKKLSGKRLILFIVLPLLLLGGAGGALWYTGILQGLMESFESAEEPGEYYDLPEMLVNLNSPGGQARYLKIAISLEVEGADTLERLDRIAPRIEDQFQIYLRELRLDDLRGSAGMYRLREELLYRVNAVSEPIEVRDILFREMLVQ